MISKQKGEKNEKTASRVIITLQNQTHTLLISHSLLAKTEREFSTLKGAELFEIRKKNTY